MQHCSPTNKNTEWKTLIFFIYIGESSKFIYLGNTRERLEILSGGVFEKMALVRMIFQNNKYYDIQTHFISAIRVFVLVNDVHVSFMKIVLIN